MADARWLRPKQITGREHARRAPDLALPRGSQTDVLEQLAPARGQIDPEE